MIQLSPEHTTLFMVLTIIGCIAISRMCIRAIVKHMDKIQAIRKNNAEFKAKMKIKEDLKANGDHHEWVSIPYGQTEVLVCKKTGWCPTINGFIYMTYINEWLKRKKMDEEYQKFRKNRVELLAEDYEMPYEHMEQLIEKIFAIKQDFHVEKMKKSVEEMQNGDKNV